MDLYANCQDAAEVIRVQNDFLEKEEAEFQANRDKIDLPPSESESSETSEEDDS